MGIVAIEIVSQTGPGLSELRIKTGVIVAAKAADSNIDVSLVTGDVIHAINGTAVETIEGLRSALDRLTANSPVVLQIERDGKLMFIAFKLDGTD